MRSGFLNKGDNTPAETIITIESLKGQKKGALKKQCAELHAELVATKVELKKMKAQEAEKSKKVARLKFDLADANRKIDKISAASDELAEAAKSTIKDAKRILRVSTYNVNLPIIVWLTKLKYELEFSDERGIQVVLGTTTDDQPIKYGVYLVETSNEPGHFRVISYYGSRLIKLFTDPTITTNSFDRVKEVVQNAANKSRAEFAAAPKLSPLSGIIEMITSMINQGKDSTDTNSTN
jgi:hypothetical protein